MRLPNQFNSERLLSELPNYLPSDIKLFDVLKSSKRFEVNEDCDSRTYKYLLPKYILIPFREYSKSLQDRFVEAHNQTTGLNLLYHDSEKLLENVSAE